MAALSAGLVAGVVVGEVSAKAAPVAIASDRITADIVARIIDIPL